MVRRNTAANMYGLASPYNKHIIHVNALQYAYNLYTCGVRFAEQSTSRRRRRRDSARRAGIFLFFFFFFSPVGNLLRTNDTRREDGTDLTRDDLLAMM